MKEEDPIKQLLRYENEFSFFETQPDNWLPINDFIYDDDDDQPGLSSLPTNYNKDHDIDSNFKESTMLGKKHFKEDEKETQNSKTEKNITKYIQEYPQDKIKLNSKNGNEKDNIPENENILSERGKKKDNFSIKLLKALNDWIFDKIIIPKSPKSKIYRPNYKIVTHNTNLLDLYIYLDLQYKNILTLTPEIKEALDQLLIDMGIKKLRKEKELEIKKYTKEYENAKRLLKKYQYIDNNIKEEDININTLIIKLLKNKGLKDPKEDKLFKKDKENINKLIKEKEEKKTFGLQDKNKDNFKKLSNINELNYRLRKLIILFYESGKEFKEFSKKVKQISENVKLQKKSSYSLLDYDKDKDKNNDQDICNFIEISNDNDTDNEQKNGFIRMVKEDVHLTQDQKDEINVLTNYFYNKNLNIEELQKYREIIGLKRQDCKLG